MCIRAYVAVRTDEDPIAYFDEGGVVDGYTADCQLCRMTSHKLTDLRLK
jgi:hypothetical protein